MTVLVNRFAILSQRIEETTNRSRLKRLLKPVAETYANRLFRELRQNTPDGSKWEDPPDVFSFRKIFPAQRSPRPSLRQHGTTMEQGWRKPGFDFIGSTGGTIRGSVTIRNIAPHAKWILDGTDGANIIERNSGNPKDHLWFFHFRRGKTSKARAVFNHPGVTPDSRLNRILDTALETGREFFREELGVELFGPLEDI